MTQQFNRSAMLDLWRLLRAAEPLRLDCTVERTDGPDLDQIYCEEMRAWYLDLLDHGPDSMLCPVNLAGNAKTESVGGGVTLISAPASVRRILSVRFSGWGTPVAPETDLEALREHAANRFRRRPLVAAVCRTVVAVSGARGTLVELLCANDDGPQIYKFDDSAIKTITSWT